MKLCRMCKHNTLKYKFLEETREMEASCTFCINYFKFKIKPKKPITLESIQETEPVFVMFKFGQKIEQTQKDYERVKKTIIKMAKELKLI